MIHLLLLVNRQGKIRLMKWYEGFPIQKRQKIVKELSIIAIGRSSRLSNVVEWNQYKVIYKRYASLYFIILCDKDDNELMMLEVIQHFVELLDRYFVNVCELDIIFNYHKAYYIVEEMLSAGYVQEVDKKVISKILSTQDGMLEEEEEEEYNPNKTAE